MDHSFDQTSDAGSLEQTAARSPCHREQVITAIVGMVLEEYMPANTRLPSGEELAQLVRRRAERMYEETLSDRALLGLSANSWKSVVAQRVAIALTFGHQ
jgi:hypothetical protein